MYTVPDTKPELHTFLRGGREESSLLVLAKLSIDKNSAAEGMSSSIIMFHHTRDVHVYSFFMNMAGSNIKIIY